MAYSDNYPGGYKSGYDSANDPDRQNNSPYEWERTKRNVAEETEKREATQSAYEQRLANERKAQEKREAERAREEAITKERERKATALFDQRIEAVKFIVNREKENFQKKGFFGKAIANIRGKDFKRQYNNIYNKAEEKIFAMDDDMFKFYYENDIEGKSR